MKIVLMGTPDFAVPTLRELTTRHEVAAVVTQPDRKKGRGKKVQFPPVKQAALEYGIPVYQPQKVKEEAFLAQLREIGPDVIVVAAFGQILPESILNLPPYGCINVHASLLPRYRGAAPIQWAIINGDEETGVTIMYMEKGLDTGDMLAKASIAVDPEETGDSLHDKLAALGGPLLLKVLDQLEAGTAERTRQNDAESSYARMLDKDLGRIHWDDEAIKIERLIRGLNSWPCAFSSMGDKTLKIWKARVADIDKNECDNTEPAAAPGTVVGIMKDAIRVACGQGCLDLLEVQLPGKKRMTVDAFLRGHNLKTGFVFGQDGPSS